MIMAIESTEKQEQSLRETIKVIQAQRKMRILARHKWVSGATITESVSGDGTIRRFTATIRGWRNFKIFEGKLQYNTSKLVRAKVSEIRDRIDAGDESVFSGTSIVGS